MYNMLAYDMIEQYRITGQWLGATMDALYSQPCYSLASHPAFHIASAWGKVTERSLTRIVTKPDWNIHSITDIDGRDHMVLIEPLITKPFGDLLHFNVQGRSTKNKRLLLIAPMSGHYATLLRSTVTSLLPDCDVFITDWHNARDIPVSAGRFDIEDYTHYLVEFIRHLAPNIHVIAVCQPVPLALAAVAYLAQHNIKLQPTTLTLIGGPVDPDVNPTEVTDFGNRIFMGQLEHHVLQRVGFKYAGAGRLVYPGLIQLISFLAMNADTHVKSFVDQILATAQNEDSEHDRHNSFYDEYLAVMDMTAEFYLSTVERIFKKREIARNAFTLQGKRVDIGAINNTAVKIIEGSRDDISAPGQCLAALDLLTGLPQHKKASHLENDAGHYGIFAGRAWRQNIRPLLLDFITANSKPQSKVTTKGNVHKLSK